MNYKRFNSDGKVTETLFNNKPFTEQANTLTEFFDSLEMHEQKALILSLHGRRKRTELEQAVEDALNAESPFVTMMKDKKGTR